MFLCCCDVSLIPTPHTKLQTYLLTYLLFVMHLLVHRLIPLQYSVFKNSILTPISVTLITFPH